MKIILKSNENSLIQVIGGRGHICDGSLFQSTQSCRVNTLNRMKISCSVAKTFWFKVVNTLNRKKISCSVAKIFRFKVTFEPKYFCDSEISLFCKKCSLCRIKYFEISSTCKSDPYPLLPLSLNLILKIQSVCLCVCVCVSMWVCLSGIGSKTMRTTVIKLLQVTQWV